MSANTARTQGARRLVRLAQSYGRNSRQCTCSPTCATVAGTAWFRVRSEWLIRVMTWEPLSSAHSVMTDKERASCLHAQKRARRSQFSLERLMSYANAPMHVWNCCMLVATTMLEFMTRGRQASEVLTRCL